MVEIREPSDSKVAQSREIAPSQDEGIAIARPFRRIMMEWELDFAAKDSVFKR